MKKIVNLLWMFPVAATLLVGCQSEDIKYSGEEYVMFSDSTYVMPVMDMDTTFCVPVAATTTANYDRNYAVEILTGKSTAIRGYHFDFANQSNNVTIKAGERVANVMLKGLYNNVGRKDSLVVSLRLIEPTAQTWNIYGNETRVELVKCYPFKMDDFLFEGGNMHMLASFPFSDQIVQYRVHSEKKDDHTIILKDMFTKQLPLRLIFDDSNPLDHLVTMPEQPAFREANYGEVWMRTVEQYPSYFNVPDRFFVLYLEAFVPQLGSFGIYQYIFKCISQEEADDEDNGASFSSNVSSISSTFKLNKF